MIATMRTMMKNNYDNYVLKIRINFFIIDILFKIISDKQILLIFLSILKMVKIFSFLLEQSKKFSK